MKVAAELEADSAHSTADQMEAAINHWEALTPMRVVGYDPTVHHSHIHAFAAAGACYSSIGREGAENVLGLDPTGLCGTGAAIHEIGHAVFLAHEQSRHDRDRYVAINMSRVASGQEHNFEKSPSQEYEDYLAYDYNSVMHYDKAAFSVDGKDTITANASALDQFMRSQAASKDVGLAGMGNRAGLSFLDRVTIDDAYRKTCYDDITPWKCDSLTVYDASMGGPATLHLSDVTSADGFPMWVMNAGGSDPRYMRHYTYSTGAGAWLYSPTADDAAAWRWKQSNHDFPPSSAMWTDSSSLYDIAITCLNEGGAADQVAWEYGEWGPCV
jgi:hypothetical protein